MERSHSTKKGKKGKCERKEKREKPCIKTVKRNTYFKRSVLIKKELIVRGKTTLNDVSIENDISSTGSLSLQSKDVPVNYNIPLPIEGAPQGAVENLLINHLIFTQPSFVGGFFPQQTKAWSVGSLEENPEQRSSEDPAGQTVIFCGLSEIFSPGFNPNGIQPVFDSQGSTISIRTDIQNKDTISFDLNIRYSTEEGYDFVRVYNDTTLIGQFSGIGPQNDPYLTVTIPITMSPRDNILVAFIKDISFYEGLDRVYIFPSNMVYSSYGGNIDTESIRTRDLRVTGPGPVIIGSNDIAELPFRRDDRAQIQLLGPGQVGAGGRIIFGDTHPQSPNGLVHIAEKGWQTGTDTDILELQGFEGIDLVTGDGNVISIASQNISGVKDLQVDGTAQIGFVDTTRVINTTFQGSTSVHGNVDRNIRFEGDKKSCKIVSSIRDTYDPSIHGSRVFLVVGDDFTRLKVIFLLPLPQTEYSNDWTLPLLDPRPGNIQAIHGGDRLPKPTKRLLSQKSSFALYPNAPRDSYNVQNILRVDAPKTTLKQRITFTNPVTNDVFEIWDQHYGGIPIEGAIVKLLIRNNKVIVASGKIISQDDLPRDDGLDDLPNISTLQIASDHVIKKKKKEEKGKENSTASGGQKGKENDILLNNDKLKAIQSGLPGAKGCHTIEVKYHRVGGGYIKLRKIHVDGEIVHVDARTGKVHDLEHKCFALPPIPTNYDLENPNRFSSFFNEPGVSGLANTLYTKIGDQNTRRIVSTALDNAGTVHAAVGYFRNVLIYPTIGIVGQGQGNLIITNDDGNTPDLGSYPARPWVPAPRGAWLFDVIEGVQQVISSHLDFYGYLSWDGQGSTVYANLNVQGTDPPCNNAFAAGLNNTINFLLGGQLAPSTCQIASEGPWNSVGVASHEFQHLVQFNLWGSPDTWNFEMGALGEGYGDVLGTMATNYYMIKNNMSYDKNGLNEGVDGGEVVGGYGIRTPSDPLKNRLNPETYRGVGTTKDSVHTDSLPMSHMAYMLIFGKSGVNDFGVSFNILPIGPENTFQLYFYVESIFLTNDTGYKEFAYGIRKAAQILFGDDHPEYISSINEALKAVNLSYEGLPPVYEDLGVIDISPSKTETIIHPPSSATGTYQGEACTACNTFNLFNQKVVVANPILADAPIINAAEMAGNVAICRRGIVSFQEKVDRCVAAGAIGVIVVNNEPQIFIPIATGPTPMMLIEQSGEAIITAASAEEVICDMKFTEPVPNPEEYMITAIKDVCSMLVEATVTQNGNELILENYTFIKASSINGITSFLNGVAVDIVDETIINPGGFVLTNLPTQPNPTKSGFLWKDPQGFLRVV